MACVLTDYGVFCQNQHDLDFAEERYLDLAEENYVATIKLCEPSSDGQPAFTDPQFLYIECRARHGLALIEFRRNRLEQGFKSIEDKINTLRSIANRYPANTDYRLLLGKSLLQLGEASEKSSAITGQFPTEAFAYYSEATQLLTIGYGDQPSVEWQTASSCSAIACARIMNKYREATTQHIDGYLKLAEMLLSSIPKSYSVNELRAILLTEKASFQSTNEVSDAGKTWNDAQQAREELVKTGANFQQDELAYFYIRKYRESKIPEKDTSSQFAILLKAKGIADNSATQNTWTNIKVKLEIYSELTYLSAKNNETTHCQKLFDDTVAVVRMLFEKSERTGNDRANLDLVILNWARRLVPHISADQWLSFSKLLKGQAREFAIAETAFQFHRDGQLDRSLQLVDELVDESISKTRDWPPEYAYNFACVYSRAFGESNERFLLARRSVDFLIMSYEKGFRNPDQLKEMAKDTDLDPVRTLPIFGEYLERINKKH
ncbi:MAG: hypothetical protein U0930_16465 [Pirellulales bacterium]